MNLNELMKDFRIPDKRQYPELDGYSDNQIYENMIGCGGLFLATKMIRQMKLKKGDIVLDLGCGLGTTSIFLAKNFDITVIAIDFWNSPETLAKRAKEEGLTSKIIPIQLDITKVIPFANEYFDAIFCLNSLFMFGDDKDLLKKILNTLKIGGSFCVGSECFNQEPDYKNIENVPKEYNFEYDWEVWDICFSKYHCPEWWKSLITETNMLDVTYCNELDDGTIIWEDSALNYNNYYSEVQSSGAMIPQEKLVDLILYGKHNSPFITLYVLAGERK